MKKLLTALDSKPQKMKAENNISPGLQSNEYGNVNLFFKLFKIKNNVCQFFLLSFA